MRFQHRHRRGHRADRRRRSSSSARCTSPRCASPTTSAATRSASSTSRGSRTSSPATDLAEGLLNNADRPPVTQPRRRARAVRRASRCRTSTRSTRAPAVDALITNRVWTGDGPAAGDHAARPPLGRRRPVRHDDEFVWVFEISGAVPPAHLDGGYAGAVSERQPPMYFPPRRRHAQGREQARARSSGRRVFVEDGGLQHGPRPRPRWSSCRRRRPSAAGRRPRRSGRSCTPCCYGVSRDQMMARHKANHIQVPTPPTPTRRPGAGRQGGDVRRARHRGPPLRRRRRRHRAGRRPGGRHG